MSRKSIILCLAVLAVMILGIGVAVAVLYSGTGGEKTRGGNVVPDQGRYMLLPAVPADAVLVACLSDTEDALDGLLSGFGFPSELADTLSAGNFRSIASSAMVASLHYSGKLQPLYVFDAGRASSEPSENAVALMEFARRRNMTAEFVDCSSLGQGSRDISKRSLVIISESDLLVKSSLRHLEKGISVMDASGFADAASSASGSDVLFFSNSHSRVLMSGMFTKKHSASHPFVADQAQWTVADIAKADDSGLYASVSAVFEDDPSDFLNVFAKAQPAVSRISQILPSYTVSAVSLPIKNMDSYISAYQSYMDYKQSLQTYKRRHRDLETKAGVKPEDFVRRLDVKEVGKASFPAGDGLSYVNLLRIGRQDTLIFVGTDNKSFENYVPSIHAWPYSSYIASVFGKFFELPDESCFTYMDGWIVSGSLEAVEQYVNGAALDYTLVEYMADAGQKDLLAPASVLTAYYSLGGYPQGHKDIFTADLAKALAPLWEEADYSPMVFSLTKAKKDLDMSLKIPRLSLLKTKAPAHERDTTVEIPQGPFRVKNSGTGRMNLFYQNSHGAVCLQEEDGKGIWGVPFKGKLCGTAQTLDYYANGKLQILFGSGSSIYLIDRLGHYVNGFPVDLGKEILLGPDVYDFNGARAYNIMVLHKDNTIEMYNLKGKKPSSWKTITAPETIKGLPERIEVGGSTFWIVRTSIQTLIYPFGGGSALTSFKGDQMIRPDSEVTVADPVSVNVSCYDGKTRTVKLK